MRLSEKSEISAGTQRKKENGKKDDVKVCSDGAASEAEGATRRDTWIDRRSDAFSRCWSKHSQFREPWPGESTT